MKDKFELFILKFFSFIFYFSFWRLKEIDIKDLDIEAEEKIPETKF